MSAHGAEAAQAETRTILFTDIRDFSRYTSERGDRQGLRLLEAHNALARGAIEAQGGAMVKTYGDGVMAAFPAPEPAVRAAVRLQSECNAYTQAHPGTPLLVGMGLHHGEMLRQQDDFFGDVVNRAKRFADEARSGQILASPVVAAAAEEANPGGEWVALGEHELKGVGAVALFELRWRDERRRLDNRNRSLSLILTRDDKLVIELGKAARSRIDAQRQRLRARAADRRGLSRWFLTRLSDWLPLFVNRALVRAGVGVEHPLERVSVAADGNQMRLRVGRFNLNLRELTGVGFDPEALQAFAVDLQAQQQALAERGA